MKFAVALCLVAACAWGQEGTGPFPAILEQDPSLPTHTVYRPQDLSKVKGKMPIIAWGNGGCANNGLSHRNFLMEIASHGFLAVAIGPPVAPQAQGKGAPKGEGKQGAPKGEGKQGDGKQAAAGPATKSSQLIDAINWALAEDGRKGSPYNGKLDASKIAVMGMSCGGSGPTRVATDPRVKFVAIFNSGILPAPSAQARRSPEEDVRRNQLDKFYTPISYADGDKTDIASENRMDDFNPNHQGSGDPPVQNHGAPTPSRRGEKFSLGGGVVKWS